MAVINGINFSDSSSGTSLSQHAQLLKLSDKRRYLTKIADVGDPYCTPSAQLSKEVIPSVTNTDIFNYLALTTSFCTSEMFKALMPTNTL